MNVVFAEALAEFEDAIDYYESREPGLGLAFADEVARALERVVAYPTAWSMCSRRSRRCVITRFPYGLIYQVKRTEVRILAGQERPDRLVPKSATRDPAFWLPASLRE